MTPSIHAIYRWIDYWPELRIEAEFESARPAGKKTKQRIRRQCPTRYKASFSDRGVYYLRAPCGAIFVVAPGEDIVDIFPLQETQQ